MFTVIGVNVLGVLRSHGSGGQQLTRHQVNNCIHRSKLVSLQNFITQNVPSQVYLYDVRIIYTPLQRHCFRVMRTLTYMLFLIHIESCGYYLASAYEGLNKNAWVYSGEGIAYVTTCITY